MPTTPYAKLRVSVNSGVPQTGGITVANGDTVALSAESTAGWGEPAAQWEIFAFPDGWAGPGAPWLTVQVAQPGGATATVYRYLGVSPPPAFTLPSLPLWGKFMLRLIVNGGLKNGKASADMTDEATALEILSPEGLHDIAWREGTQFGLWRRWVGHLAANLRIIDTKLAAAGSVDSVSATAPLAVGGTAKDPILSIAPASGVTAGSMSIAHFGALNARTSSAASSTIAERDGSGSCAFATVTCSFLDSPAATNLVLRRAGADRMTFESDRLSVSLPTFNSAVDQKGIAVTGTVNKDTGSLHVIQVDMTVTTSGDGMYYMTFTKNGSYEFCIQEGGALKWLTSATASLSQVTTASATGSNFSIYAQGAATTGGDIVLVGGSGGTTKGGIQFWSGGTNVAKIWHNGTSGTLDINSGAGSTFTIKTAVNQGIALQYQTTKRIEINSTGIGFFAANPVAKPTVTGSRGGNAALASLISALASLGLITDSTTA